MATTINCGCKHRRLTGSRQQEIQKSKSVAEPTSKKNLLCTVEKEMSFVVASEESTVLSEN